MGLRVRRLTQTVALESQAGRAMGIWPELRSLWQHLFSAAANETPIQPIAIIGEAESSPTYSGKAAPSQFKNLQGGPRPANMDVRFERAISRLACHLPNQTPLGQPEIQVNERVFLSSVSFVGPAAG
jgi:hypothetical protein